MTAAAHYVASPWSWPLVGHDDPPPSACQLTEGLQDRLLTCSREAAYR
jgi:hypothetical protein